VRQLIRVIVSAAEKDLQSIKELVRNLTEKVEKALHPNEQASQAEQDAKNILKLGLTNLIAGNQQE